MFDICIGVFIALILFSSVTGGTATIKTKWWRAKYDVTDDPIKKLRSNLTVYTDYGTGCQYIRTGMGGLTPRVDKEGKIICVKGRM